AAVFLCIPLFTRRSILKVYAQKPDRDMVVTYEITSERVATRSEIASSDIIWRAISRGIRVPEGFLFYISDRMFHWLPVHGFQDTADVERLAQLAKSKVQQYEDKT